MEANVTANCVHPGIVRTRLTRDREGLITGHYFTKKKKIQFYLYNRNIICGGT